MQNWQKQVLEMTENETYNLINNLEKNSYTTIMLIKSLHVLMENKTIVIRKIEDYVQYVITNFIIHLI